MGVDASWPLKAAIQDVLRRSNHMRSAMGESGRFPETDCAGTQHEALPAVAFSRMTSRVWHSATFDGQDHEIVLQIDAKDRKTLRDISRAVTEILHNADFPVSGHALIEMSFESSQTSDDVAGEQNRCLMFFRALTVSD